MRANLKAYFELQIDHDLPSNGKGNFILGNYYSKFANTMGLFASLRSFGTADALSWPMDNTKTGEGRKNPGNDIT